MPRKVTAQVVHLRDLQPAFDQVYPGGDSLFEDAFNGGPALPLVQFALNLRRNDKTRQHLAYFKTHWDTRQQKSSIKERVLATYHMYRSMLVLARPGAANKMKQTSQGDVSALTKAQRQALQGSGMVLMRREAPTVRAENARRERAALLHQNHTLLWVDNYHRHRYSKRPDGNREQSFSATAIGHLGGEHLLRNRAPGHFAPSTQRLGAAGNVHTSPTGHRHLLAGPEIGVCPEQWCGIPDPKCLGACGTFFWYPPCAPTLCDHCGQGRRALHRRP